MVHNLAEDARYPEASLLMDNGVRSCSILPLTTVAIRRLGAVGFGYGAPRSDSEVDVEFLRQVAQQIAVAVDNALAHQEAPLNSRPLLSPGTRRPLRLLLDLNNTLSPNLALRDLFRAVSSNVRRVMRCDYASVILPEPDGENMRIYAQETVDWRAHGRGTSRAPYGHAGPVSSSKRVKRWCWASESWRASIHRRSTLALGMKSACFLPLTARGRLLGTLNVCRFPRAHHRGRCGLSASSGRPGGAGREQCPRLRSGGGIQTAAGGRRVYLNEEIRSELNFEEIIGSSAVLKNVLKQVAIVAPTDSTVLILGETGVGKELVARAIHNLSGRRDHTFVKVNCAAIPLGLLESELFGHEKGAFTGASCEDRAIRTGATRALCSWTK